MIDFKTETDSDTLTSYLLNKQLDQQEIKEVINNNNQLLD